MPAKAASTPTRGNKNKPRPGGRTDRNRKAVASAVLTLIEAGDIHFELQEVARLSNVHRTTIFRRWPKREDLLQEALAYNASRLDIPAAKDWQEYLYKLGHTLADFLYTPAMVAIGSLMAAPVTPREFADQATMQFGFVIDRMIEPLVVAQKRGDFRADANPHVILNLLLSYVLTFTVISKVKPSKKIINETVRNLCIIGERP